MPSGDASATGRADLARDRREDNVVAQDLVDHRDCPDFAVHDDGGPFAPVSTREIPQLFRATAAEHSPQHRIPVGIDTTWHNVLHGIRHIVRRYQNKQLGAFPFPQDYA